MVIFFVLGAIGFDILPLLAGAGVVGITLAFGAQSLVKDFFASLFILGENQYRVGDVLQVNQGVAGLVERITLRMTVLRALDGKVHYVPNGSIEIATNLTMEFAQVDLNIGVAYDSDIDQVERIINKVGKAIYEDEKWQGVVLEPAQMLRVDSFDDSAITVKIVCKTAPIRQWEVKSEILRKVKKAFDKEGIEIPFPQRVIHTK
jgi:small conductance mechanosensitive channel